VVLLNNHASGCYGKMGELEVAIHWVLEKPASAVKMLINAGVNGGMGRGDWSIITFYQGDSQRIKSFPSALSQAGKKYFQQWRKQNFSGIEQQGRRSKGQRGANSLDPGPREPHLDTI